SSKSGGGGVSGVARIGGVCADQRDGVVADSVYFTQSSSYAGQMAAAGGAPAKQPQLRPGQSSDSGSLSSSPAAQRCAMETARPTMKAGSSCSMLVDSPRSDGGAANLEIEQRSSGSKL
uniref:HIPK2 n=1 Tax=Macrostomum lignano TaxID=282301 RepID=A0A1I8FNS8_9PLAT